MPDPRWQFLERARPLLVAAFADRGVVRVDFIANFDSWSSFSVWLCTATDAHRETVNAELLLADQVRAVLIEAGFHADQVEEVTVAAESQETVDRDFEGSWFYAMR